MHARYIGKDPKYVGREVIHWAYMPEDDTYWVRFKGVVPDSRIPTHELYPGLVPKSLEAAYDPKPPPAKPICAAVPPSAPPLGAPGRPALPIDSAERKRWPLFSGLLRYFPAALAQVSNHSFLGNEKHNPGLPLQHARGKSGDHEDCIVRHLVDASEHKPGSAARIDELRALAWRTLALLQEECEIAGHKAAPAASFNHKESNGRK